MPFRILPKRMATFNSLVLLVTHAIVHESVTRLRQSRWNEDTPPAIKRCLDLTASVRTSVGMFRFQRSSASWSSGYRHEQQQVLVGCASNGETPFNTIYVVNFIGSPRFQSLQSDRSKTYKRNIPYYRSAACCIAVLAVTTVHDCLPFRERRAHRSSRQDFLYWGREDHDVTEGSWFGLDMYSLAGKSSCFRRHRTDLCISSCWNEVDVPQKVPEGCLGRGCRISCPTEVGGETMVWVNDMTLAPRFTIKD